MELNDLLLKHGLDLNQVLVLQTQGERLEKAMQNAAYVASFIGHEPGKALFVGLYKIGATKSLTREEDWQVPAYVERKALGMDRNTPCPLSEGALSSGL